MRAAGFFMAGAMAMALVIVVAWAFSMPPEWWTTP